MEHAPDIGLGNIRYPEIGERNGFVFGPGRAGVGSCGVLGPRVPESEVFQDSFDHVNIVDECDDAHVATAVDALTNAFSKEPM
jgi:hypothetical protein